MLRHKSHKIIFTSYHAIHKSKKSVAYLSIWVWHVQKVWQVVSTLCEFLWVIQEYVCRNGCTWYGNRPLSYLRSPMLALYITNHEHRIQTLNRYQIIKKNSRNYNLNTTNIYLRVSINIFVGGFLWGTYLEGMFVFLDHTFPKIVILVIIH